MKRACAVVLSLLPWLASPPAWSQDACSDCRRAAVNETNRCEQSARGPAQRADCDKKLDSLTKACDAGACKGRPAPVSLEEQCSQCRMRVATDANHCVQVARSDKATCEKRSAEGNRLCDAGPCKTSPTKYESACAECRNKAVSEEQRCAALRPAESVGCLRKAQEFRKTCDDGACKALGR